MSKNKLLLLLALLLTAATGPAWAQGPWTSGACTVTLSDGVMTVSGTGAMADYADSYATPWYGYCSNAETIVIESGVTSIGNSAFAKSYKVESVSIPASVTSIGKYAFEECGSEATTAPTVSFAEGSTPLTIGERAFNYANLKSIDIPNRVTSIGERAFNSCSNLESVSIPASVTSIGEGAFRNCSMLAKVYIYAPSLTTYGADAFQSNASGRKIYVLPEAVDTYKAGWSAYAADIEAMTLYATSVKDGVKDADKWTISPNPAPEGSPVTLQYTGRLKVKGVTATSDAAPAAKPAATVTTAPQAKTDVKAGSTTALIEAGVADGGTMMYAVTTTNTKPTSTDGFSGTVPTAQTITASGTVYVWYYVKGDDTHSDSDIAGPVSVAVAEALPALSITSPSVGQVIGSDGKNYAYGSVPSGVTKVAMIAYVSGSNGLAIALADEGSLNWATAKSTCEAKTPAFTGGTWHLPSQAEWNLMFQANGGDEERCYGLNAAINTAGGTALLEGGTGYWSSTPDGSKARYVWLMDGDTDWRSIIVNIGRQVRACLAF